MFHIPLTDWMLTFDASVYSDERAFFLPECHPADMPGTNWQHTQLQKDQCYLHTTKSNKEQRAKTSQLMLH